jgi:4-hydroxybenzoate polyprenyltransferase
LLRLVHPFPSALDAIAAGAVALVAGAVLDVSVRLGLGMLALQFAIGSANDLADADSDAAVKPWKPIPAGLVGRMTATTVCAAAAVLGLTLAASVSVGALVVAAVGLTDGLLYDLRLKATPIAWLPFAAGVGLLPLYAWLGARNSVPPAFAGVVAMSVLAGTTLALANAYSDLDRDRRSGVTSIAVYLGSRRTVTFNAGLLLIVQIVAGATTIAASGAPGLVAAEIVGCVLGWLGLALAAVDDNRLRPLVWELQAIGVALLGIAWLATLASAGALGG